MQELSKRKNELQAKKRALIISFTVPFLVVILSYALKGVAPFGDNTICSMDGFSQYFPMLENMGNAVKNGELFYSFSGALGFNLWAQNAYYTNSPLWLLIYILPQKLHISGINLLVAFKIGLSAVFFCIYLLSCKHSSKRSHYTYLCPAFSCAWALSEYILAYINQLMWLDVIMLLPLVILGLERLVEKDKPILYILMLFLSIWSCFYLGYMVCIFVCLYFLYLVFSKKTPVKVIIKKGVCFTFSSLVSAGMAAVVLIPVYMALKNTIASDITFTSIEISNTFFEFLSQFLPLRKISLEYGAPNLYCTLTAVLLLILFFFQKQISKRERICSGIFVAFMSLSMCINLGDYVWHGFHFPNQLPSRQSFLLIFLVLIFAYKCACCNNVKVNIRQFISIIMIFACSLNAFVVLISQTWISKSSSLQRFDTVMENFTMLDDDGFIRMEFKDEKKNNGPQQYSFNGVSYYSSTMSGDAFKFFENIGLERYAKNVSVYYKSSDILDSIFGIKYLIEKDRITLSKNDYALPLAFLSDESVLSFSPEEYSDKKKCQQQFWKSLTGKNKTDLKNDSAELKKCGMEITLYDTDLIAGKIKCKNDGILFTTIPYDEGWEFFIDGNKSEIIKCADYFSCCKISEGEHTVTFRYTVPGIKAGAAVSAVCFTVFILTLIKTDIIPHSRKKSKKEESV